MKQVIALLCICVCSFAGGAVAQIMSLGAQVASFTQLLVHATPSLGSTNTPVFWSQNSFSGTVTSGPVYWNEFGTSADTVDLTNATNRGGINLYNGYTFGGATMKGIRTGFQSSIFFTAASGNVAGDGTFYTAGAFNATCSAADGGTSPAPNGNCFGGLTRTELKSGATFFNGVTAHEFDCGVDSGASTSKKQCVKVVQLAADAVAGSLEDVAFEIANQVSGTAPGWGTGIAFGGTDGWWPISSTGTMIGTFAATVAGGPSIQAKFGVDLSAVTFTSGGSPFLAPLITPASSLAACKTGAIEWDAGFIYICTTTNNWKRAALASF